MAPIGLAIPLPAIVGAEPWIGSYRACRLRSSETLPPSDADGSRPMEPASTDASSVRMSPNMFSVSTTSKLDGRVIRCIAHASTSMCSSARSAYSSRTTRVTTWRQSRDVSSTFALSTDVMRPRRARAKVHAMCVTRSTSASEYVHTSRATTPSSLCLRDLAPK